VSPGAATGSPALGNHPPSAHAPEWPKAVPPHPSAAPSGMSSPAAPSPSEREGHWGRGPVGDAPRWGGSEDSNHSQPARAAPPASGNGYPASGGVAPRAAPPPAPPTGNPASGRVAPSMPAGNQGLRAPPDRNYAGQQFPSAMRAPPPIAYRSAPAPQSFAGNHSAPAPQSFAGNHSAPAPHSSSVHVGGGAGWGRARQ
jgi:hypothetical protein